jgi:hypothetical protein
MTHAVSEPSNFAFRPARPEPPRLALRPEEASAALGISRDLYDSEVLPHLRVVRIGSLKVVPVSVLQTWLERNAAVILDGER